MSSVTTMYEMFSDAHSFNGDISAWDVSNVTNMGYMFWKAHSFNGDISAWDVSNVTNMYEMFLEAESFNQDISSWNVSNVTNMAYMFWHANALSDANKCMIHASYQSNDAWTYDWSDLCLQVGYVFVPDDNFEQALIDLGYDDVIDNIVVADSINSVTFLDVDNKETVSYTHLRAHET